ncbi:MAG: hypothetical protein ABIQ12_00105, partial [Opitutaceae bacterium]
ALGGEKAGRAVRLARQGLGLTAALMVVVIAIGAVGSGGLLRLIDPRAQVAANQGWWLIFLAVAGVGLALLANYTTAVGVALRQARPHTVIVVLSAGIGIGATLALLGAGWGVLALPAAGVARHAVQAGLSFRLVQIELVRLSAVRSNADTVKIDSVDWRALGWLAVEKLTGTLAVSADLFLLGRVFDGGVVTAYALTKRPVDLAGSLFHRQAIAFSPTVSFRAGGENSTRLGKAVAAMSRRILWLLGGAVLGTFLLLQPIVDFWVGPAHYLGGVAAPILAVTLAANVLSGVSSHLYWASGATTSFCRINSALSTLSVAGALGGLYGFGVMGLLIGALLPRLLFAAWLFPKLAAQALGLVGAVPREIGREAARVALAVTAGAFVASLLPTAEGMTAWGRGAAGLSGYAVILIFGSGALRREMRALATLC